MRNVASLFCMLLFSGQNSGSAQLSFLDEPSGSGSLDHCEGCEGRRAQRDTVGKRYSANRRSLGSVSEALSLK